MAKHDKPNPRPLTDADEAAGRQLLHAFHAAVMTGDDRSRTQAHAAYRALVKDINGGTSFGSSAGDKAPGPALARRLAATDGDVPMWGQSGCFVVNVDGMLTMVKTNDIYDMGMGYYAHMAFHVIELDQPFISPTGFRSHFYLPRRGLTVAENAAANLRDLMRERITKIEDASSYEQEAACRRLQLQYVAAALAEAAAARQGKPRRPVQVNAVLAAVDLAALQADHDSDPAAGWPTLLERFKTLKQPRQLASKLRVALATLQQELMASMLHYHALRQDGPTALSDKDVMPSWRGKRPILDVWQSALQSQHAEIQQHHRLIQAVMHALNQQDEI